MADPAQDIPQFQNPSLKDISAWGFANALKQKFDLENAVIGRGLKGSNAPTTIPFGSTVTNTITNTTGLGKIAQAAMLALGVGGGGLGLAHLAGIGGSSAPVVSAPVPQAESSSKAAPAVEDQFIDGVIEWSWDGENEPIIKPRIIDGSGS